MFFVCYNIGEQILEGGALVGSSTQVNSSRTSFRTPSSLCTGGEGEGKKRSDEEVYLFLAPPAAPPLASVAHGNARILLGIQLSCFPTCYQIHSSTLEIAFLSQAKQPPSRVPTPKFLQQSLNQFTPDSAGMGLPRLGLLPRKLSVSLSVSLSLSIEETLYIWRHSAIV